MLIQITKQNFALIDLVLRWCWFNQQKEWQYQYVERINPRQKFKLQLSKITSNYSFRSLEKQFHENMSY